MPPVDSYAQASSREPNEFVCLRNFTGNYYRALGWFVVISSVVSVATVYWTNYLHIDLSFILWFWLGSSLKNGNPTARKWAIAIFLVVCVFLVAGYFIPGVKANFGDYEFDRSHPAFFVIAGVIGIIFSVPGAMLIGQRGRAAFERKKDGEQGRDGDAEESV